MHILNIRKIIIVKQFGQILPELGFQPRALRLCPTYQATLPTSPKRCYPPSLPFLPKPLSYSTYLSYIPGPCHHLQRTAPHLPHPLPDIHIPHCVHLLPIQSLPETSANRALPSPALPSLSHTQSALLLHLFTGTHIHHEPQRMPQEADLTLLLWTSHQAQV